MPCPDCGYMLDVFDRECPRCRGKSTAPAQSQSDLTTDNRNTPNSPVTPLSPNSPTTSSPVAPPSARPYGLQIAGSLIVLLGMVCAAYYLRFYDTSLFVPAAALAEGGTGPGRLVPRDPFLMAEKQSGLLMGAGLALLGATLFAVGQYLPSPNAPAQPNLTPQSNASAQPNPPAQPTPLPDKADGDLWLLYLLSALLPPAGVVLVAINRGQPPRAQAAAIGTGIGVFLALSLWLGWR